MMQSSWGMRSYFRIFLTFALALAGGCGTPRQLDGTDGGSDSAKDVVNPAEAGDVSDLEASSDARSGDVNAEAGKDTVAAADGGADSIVTQDAGADSVVMPDTGADSVVMPDTGTDTLVMPDTGTDLPCSSSFASDQHNCGFCGHDCLGGLCSSSACQPAKLADIPHEVVRTIGLSPSYVLVGGDRGQTGGAAIYTVSKLNGTVNQTRPPRVDGSHSSRLVGTGSTLIAADVFSPEVDLFYLSHCSLANCSPTTPPAGSYTFDGTHDFVFDRTLGRAFWFDPTNQQLFYTNPDAWAPQSLGATTAVTGQGTSPFAMTLVSGVVYAAFTNTIVAVPEDGHSGPVNVSGLPSDTPLRLAASPESLVIKGFSGSIYKAPLPGGIGNRLPDAIPGITGAVAISISGSTLFWSGNSTIYSCALPLCAQIQPIAQDAALVQDLIADDTAVYWLSEPAVADATGTVMRLAR